MKPSATLKTLALTASVAALVGGGARAGRRPHHRQFDRTFGPRPSLLPHRQQPERGGSDFRPPDHARPESPGDARAGRSPGQNVDPTTWRIKLRSGVTFQDGAPADRRGCHLFAQPREGHSEQPSALHRQCRRDRQHDGDRSADHRIQDEGPDARTSSSRSASSTSSRRSSPKERRSRPSTIGRPRSAQAPTR